MSLEAFSDFTTDHWPDAAGRTLHGAGTRPFIYKRIDSPLSCKRSKSAWPGLSE
jgi:hypothetical protein